MDRAKCYRALLAKDVQYDGVFFVGVKTTGVFCQPSCPARKPKFENCEFFETAEEALLASYRPCKRCRPLCNPHQVPESVRLLVEAVERDPDRRWKDQDFEALSIDASTARRQFKKRFGMTFVQYARARRIGLAMKQIRSGESVINAQLDAGYESDSGFREAVTRLSGAAPSASESLLEAAWLDTPLGPMVAIGDSEALYLLEFVGRRGLERELERLPLPFVPGKPPPIVSIEEELARYFAGEQMTFNTPIKMLGTPFQREVWTQLLAIPAGETCSYRQLAEAVGKPSGYRAVAQANGANQLAIIIPCHRVINANGELGGYGGGVARKKWLLDHEKLR